MNIRDFQYLVSVAKHKHFGKAADECYVSQPALSMQIQKLESVLGVKVFERSNKHVMVTDVGEKVVKRAKVVLEEIEHIKEIAKTAGDPEAIELRLGAFPSLLHIIYLKLFLRLQKTFPK